MPYLVGAFFLTSEKDFAISSPHEQMIPASSVMFTELTFGKRQ